MVFQIPSNKERPRQLHMIVGLLGTFHDVGTQLHTKHMRVAPVVMPGNLHTSFYLPACVNFLNQKNSSIKNRNAFQQHVPSFCVQQHKQIVLASSKGPYVSTERIYVDRQ